MSSKHALLLVMLTGLLSGCGLNQLANSKQNVEATWSDLLIQLKNRTDMVQPLVAVVQGYAGDEKKLMARVTTAHATIVGLELTRGSVEDPVTVVARFLRAQEELGRAVLQLIELSDRYPGLRADQSFRLLKQEVVDTESRIIVARRRYVTAAQEYNDSVNSFPNGLIAKAMGWQTQADLTATN
jgi:LemA protein